MGFEEEIGGWVEDRFEHLYIAHSDRAVRLAYLMVGDRAIAQEIAQEAFVRVLARFRFGRRIENFEAYFFRTVANLARGHLRKQRVRRLFLDRQAAPQLDSEGSETERGLELWTAVKRLPVRQRTAIFLRFHEDLSEARIAEFMGCSPSAVKSLISRAMAGLREDEMLKGEKNETD